MECCNKEWNQIPFGNSLLYSNNWKVYIISLESHDFLFLFLEEGCGRKGGEGGGVAGTMYM